MEIQDGIQSHLFEMRVMIDSYPKILKARLEEGRLTRKNENGGRERSGVVCRRGCWSKKSASFGSVECVQRRHFIGFGREL